ncbi:GD11664 [Drosophila simulans]|uniref:GD11664 n=1 Tax=Drosophila simulans TaxID=7240 RepID=B4QH49_DROSI|nr:GD11664 [Drosophila simulans]
MIKARDSTRLLLISLLIGQLYVSCSGSPIDADDKGTDYQDDEYEYGDDGDDADTQIFDVTKNHAEQEAPPYFEVMDLRVEAKPGDDVVLNCDARNFQLSNAVMWYKNRIIIANGQNPINQRVQCMLNNSILLKNVSPEDSDDYYCEILPQRDLNGQPSAVDNQNGVIILDNVDEKNAGDYQCLADDGSRHPPHGTVHIDVQYSPIVSTHRHNVNTEKGATAELYCNYRAKPIGRSYFIKDGKTLQLSDKYSLKDSVHNGHNRTTLLVREVTDSDLGEYLCQVENAIGSNEVKVHVSYNPETPQFEDMTVEGNKVTLHWLVRSHQLLSEAMLDYQLTGSYTWSTVQVLETHRHNNTDNIWKITHQLELSRGVWHARVKTKNTKGWSHFSNDHVFEIPEYSEVDKDEEVEMPPDEIVRAGIMPMSKGAASSMQRLNVGVILLAALLLRVRL